MERFKDAVLSYRKGKAMEYLKRVFGDYYRAHPPVFPPDLTKREWGFFPFLRGGMRRHVAFSNPDEAVFFFKNDTPRHAYYSAAFYKEPGAARMELKEWQGAELIFDLDADHVAGAETMTYEEQLAAVKKEVVKLLRTYILDVLGFDEENVELLFSGGRGYHIHVKDPRVYGLGSKERRGIVDFIMGTGLDHEWLFPKRPLDMKTFGRHVKVRFMREMPKMNSLGWQGIMSKGIRRFIGDLENMGKKEALAHFKALVKTHDLKDDKGKNYGKVRIEKTFNNLFDGERGKRGVDILKRETFEAFSDDRYRDLFLNLIQKEVSVNLSGETDQPVTTDTHRLIRVPGSLHGKTGFRVCPIPLDQAESFDPLNDAVVFPDKEIAVEAVLDGEINLKGNNFKLIPGIHELPMYAAVFFLASGRAILPKEAYKA